MTMVSTAYKTQTRLSDLAIAHLLIAGFTGQLKGWWDNYLSPFQQNEILTSVKTDETGSSTEDEDGLQMDELDWSSDEKSINVLTKYHKFLLEIADQIQNPLLRKHYLEKLKQGTLEGEIKTPNYNLSEILKRHDKKRAHKTSFDAQKEVEILRSEIDCLKFETQQHSTIIGRLEELIIEASKPSDSSDKVLMNQDKNPDESLALDQTKKDQHETLTMIGEPSPNRWLIKITLVINHNLLVDATALFDIGADENCINEQLIPARFYEKTTESLSSVSGTKLDIQYKLSEVEVEQNRVRNMELPWFDQACEGSSSRSKTHKHQNPPLPPKKRFCIKSSLTAWRPDPRQQLILDDLWASIKNSQKGEESINALVFHMEEQSNSKASLQQELCLKIDSLQHELSLQKAQTQDFLQNRLVEFDNFTEHFA
ncbi:hypothetical protein CRG98_019837 [Punica granatum]|uniref:Uncharacterized protein n=1 Tax=Punica granatum TaxID=22663 RepID=A0A2I0JU36_PUNGR|nr:hypothetical protein CRG98_019837 [Punica granatum]